MLTYRSSRLFFLHTPLVHAAATNVGFTRAQKRERETACPRETPRDQAREQRALEHASAGVSSTLIAELCSQFPCSSEGMGS